VQLRRLLLRNIRSYRTAELDLGPGTTLIVGDVGSGKTSLLYGIELALFGFAEVDAPFLVRHGASEAEVTVGLQDGEDQIEVSRHLRRQQRRARPTFEVSAATFRRNAAATQYSATELRQRVIELLGFPDNPSPRAHSDLWRWAVYLPQERMREVLDQEAGSRQETVRKALGLEQYRIAAENAHDVVAPRLRVDAEKLEAEAEGLRHHDDEFTRLTAEIEVQETALPQLRSEGEVRRAVRDEARSALERVEARRRSAELDRARLEELDQQAAIARKREGELAEQGRTSLGQRTSLEGEWAQLASAAGEAEHHRTLVEGLRRTRTELRERSENIAPLVVRLATLRAERAGLLATMRETEHRVTEFRGESERIGAELQAAEHDGPTHEPPAPTSRTLEEIDREIVEVDARRSSSAAEAGRLDGAAHELDELLAGGRCPRCHQAVRPEEFETHRAEATVASDQARERLAELDSLAHRLREERRARERFERARDHWLERERQRAELRARRSRADATLAESIASRERTVAHLHEAEGQLAALEPRETENALLVQELDRHERALDEAERRGTELVRRLERRHALDEQRTVAQRRSEEIEREFVAAREHAAALAERRRELAERLPDLAALDGELARCRTERDRADAADTAAAQAVARADQQLVDRRERRDASVEGRRRRGELTAEATHRRALASWLSGPFTDALEVVEHRRLAAAQVEFERTLARHFATLVEDPAMVARCGNSFAPAVEIEGEWTPPEALSGGERTALALAFRLALGEVVRGAGRLKLETLLLDEPTDGFSPEQVVRMGELIESLHIPQVILVSHEGALAAIADRVIHVRKIAGESVMEGSQERNSARTRPASEAAAAPSRATVARKRPRKRTTLDDTSAEAPPAV
jgi:DNA repair protein SbcC/Rad50